MIAMSIHVDIRPISADDPTHVDAVAGLWTGACGAELPISLRFVSYNLRLFLNVLQNTRFAWANHEPIDFVIASAPSYRPVSDVATDSRTDDQSNIGWINAIAVLPEMQRCSVGSRLLDWAEQWLHEQGMTHATLEGNLRPFAPGLPTTVDTMSYFSQRGYEPVSTVWDVVSNLSTYTPPSVVGKIDGAIQPAQPGQEQSLTSFEILTVVLNVSIPISFIDLGGNLVRLGSVQIAVGKDIVQRCLMRGCVVYTTTA